MPSYHGKVISLRAMGFTESASFDALEHSLGNVDKAIDRLTGADGVAQVKQVTSSVKRVNAKTGRDGGGGGGGGGLASMFQRSRTSASPSAPARQLAGGSSRPSAGTPVKRPHTSSASGGKGKTPATSQSWLSRPSPPSGSGRSAGGSQEERGPEVVVEDSEDGGAGGRSRPPSQTIEEAREGQHAPSEGRHSAGADSSGSGVPIGSVVRGGPSGGRGGSGGDGGAGAGAPEAKRRKVAAGVPLSERMRPEDFAGLVGQREAAEMMCGMTESGTLQSVILWGPPGSCHDPKPETQNPDP